MGNNKEQVSCSYERGFKKGYEQATKAWGKDLPDISKQTYEAVEEKFAAWKNEANGTTTETEPVEE